MATIPHRFQTSIPVERLADLIGLPDDGVLLDIDLDHATGHVRIVAASALIQPDPDPSPGGGSVPYAARHDEVVRKGNEVVSRKIWWSLR